jgi:short-subunit dehydrogenase
VSASAAAARRPSLGIRRGEAALITGASSGIGEAFARTLAGRGVSLLLTALPAELERLDALAGELAERHGVRCVSVAMDLAVRDGADRLLAAADEVGFAPDLLVNSAGVGDSGRFADAPLERQIEMVHVNVEAVVRLTRLFLPRMVRSRGGAIINVASTAAFQPLPYFAVYAASKAFVLSFGEGLWAEHRRAGVRVITVCSGPVATAFHGAPGNGRPQAGVKGFLKRRYMTSQRVVDAALAAVERDRPIVVLRMPVVGLLYYPAAVARGFVPLRTRLLVSERLNRWYFEQRA